MTRNQYVGLIGVLLLFGLFGWPTLYANRTMKGDAVRINRLTGCMDVSSSDGWRRIPGASGDCMTAEQKKAAADEKEAAAARHGVYTSRKATLIDKLRADASGGPVDRMTENYHVNIYNNSNCSIDTLTIKVNGRTYKGYTSIFSPLSAHDVGEFEYKIIHPEEVNGGKNDWDMTDIEYSSPGQPFEDSSCVLE